MIFGIHEGAMGSLYSFSAVFRSKGVAQGIVCASEHPKAFVHFFAFRSDVREVLEVPSGGECLRAMTTMVVIKVMIKLSPYPAFPLTEALHRLCCEHFGQYVISDFLDSLI